VLTYLPAKTVTYNHSSLFAASVSDEVKILIALTSVDNNMKLFFFVNETAGK